VTLRLIALAVTFAATASPLAPPPETRDECEAQALAKPLRDARWREMVDLIEAAMTMRGGPGGSYFNLSAAETCPGCTARATAEAIADKARRKELADQTKLKCAGMAERKLAPSSPVSTASVSPPLPPGTRPSREVVFYVARSSSGDELLEGPISMDQDERRAFRNKLLKQIAQSNAPERTLKSGTTYGTFSCLFVFRRPNGDIALITKSPAAIEQSRRSTERLKGHTILSPAVCRD